mgnify:CR=1 FL=1
MINTEFVLGLFAEEDSIAKEKFEMFMNESNEDVCLDYEEKHRTCDEEIIRILKGKYGVRQGFFHILNRNEKEKILKELKSIRGVTIRQLARVTGVSKYLVEKA